MATLKALQGNVMQAFLLLHVTQTRRDALGWLRRTWKAYGAHTTAF